MALGPAEQLAHSTIRIECEFGDGALGTGTGLFYSLDRKEDQHVPVIITNKHVIDGAVKGRFLMTLQDEDGGPNMGLHQIFEFDNFERFWTSHPDPNVDLCAMAIAPLLREAKNRDVRFYFVTLDSSYIPSQEEIDDMLGLENVIMIGYPNGLWDKENNLPIFRRGGLATDYKRNWNGRKEFLIDAACFPGSSGSPIMLFDIGSYQTRKGNFLGSSRVKLLGVLYAGPQHTVEGEVVVIEVPVHKKPVAVAGIPNNLGIVLKSELLLAFEGLSQRVAEQGAPAELER